MAARFDGEPLGQSVPPVCVTPVCDGLITRSAVAPGGSLLPPVVTHVNAAPLVEVGWQLAQAPMFGYTVAAKLGGATLDVVELDVDTDVEVDVELEVDVVEGPGPGVVVETVDGPDVEVEDDDVLEVVVDNPTPAASWVSVNACPAITSVAVRCAPVLAWTV